jgi:hypothetical protein
VRLEDATQIDNVKIFLPGPPSAWIVEDCGPRFSSPDIAQGIFNEELTSNVATLPRRIELLKPDQSCFCRVHIFPAQNGAINDNELIQEAMAGGLLLTITPHALNEACVNLLPTTPIYFRLRAYYRGQEEFNPFIKRIKPRDRFFQTGYSVVDYLDFRLNEARSLPSQVESLMRSGTGPVARLKLAAFLTAVPVQSDVTTISWDKAHKKRLLEDDLWETYAPTGVPKGMMVYHWKEVADGPTARVEAFSGFVKIQTRLVSWYMLLTSIFLAFVFGVLGNLLASWIWYYSHRTAKTATAAPANILIWPLPTPNAPLKLNNAKSDTGQK